MILLTKVGTFNKLNCYGHLMYHFVYFTDLSGCIQNHLLGTHFFSVNVNLFKAKIILILQKYLFWGYSKWHQIKQYTKLEQKSVSKFLLAKNCKPYENYRRIWDVYWQACFNEKMFTNRLNMGLLLQAWDSLWSKNTVFPVRKKSVKKVMLTWKNHHFWFPWKKCNYKQCFLLPTPLAKFTLFIEWPSY